jgi:hypothetical protein
MELLGDMSQMESCFGLYGDSVNLGARSVHGLRRMYMAMQIILGAPDGTPGQRGSSRSSFWSVWR